MPSIDALADRLSTYLGPDQVNLVRRAYFYAEQAHDGQRRRSGEAYVTHPLAVANILADMHMDHQSLMAAMLHDVIEDTGIAKEALTAQFGETIAELVDGSPAALDTLKELSAALGNDPNFATTVATQIGRKVDKVAGKGLSTEDYTSEEKAKLAGISSGANNYRHPASHPASMIEQDATHRFITDTERSTWNGKASTAVATQSANGLMSSADKKKLDDLTDGEVIIQCSIPGMN